MVNTRRQEIDFASQSALVNGGDSFHQEVWGSFQRDGLVHIYLSFEGNLPSEGREDPDYSSTSISKYLISHSPCHVSPAFGFPVS